MTSFASPAPATVRSRKWSIGGSMLIALLLLLICLRLYLGVCALHYVNRSLSHIEGYQGSVQAIDLSLYRGAYVIHGLKLYKTEAGIPTPFIAIDTADIAIEWAALFHGHVVSNIALEKPVINFAVNKSAKQTGGDTDWTKPIRALAPIDINHVTFNDGKLTYQDFSSDPKVNIYIHNMQGEVDNLRNVEDAAHPLPSRMSVRGDSIGGGALAVKGRLNILKEIPDMNLAAQLENISLPALNDYSNAYAGLDFKAGDLSVYSKLIINDDNVSGYVKPIAKHISLVDLHKESNPIKVAWESVASTLITIFTNHHTDEFATRADLQGDLHNINTNTLSAIGGILRNAFITAIKKGFDDDGKGALIPPEPDEN